MSPAPTSPGGWPATAQGPENLARDRVPSFSSTDAVPTPAPSLCVRGEPEALPGLSAPALPGGPAAHRDECLFSGTGRDSHGAARRDKGPALGDIQQLQGTAVGLSSLGPNSPIVVESSGTAADPRSSPSSFLCVLGCGGGWDSVGDAPSRPRRHPAQPSP